MRTAHFHAWQLREWEQKCFTNFTEPGLKQTTFSHRWKMHVQYKIYLWSIPCWKLGRCNKNMMDRRYVRLLHHFCIKFDIFSGDTTLTGVNNITVMEMYMHVVNSNWKCLILLPGNRLNSIRIMDYTGCFLNSQKCRKCHRPATARQTFKSQFLIVNF